MEQHADHLPINLKQQRTMSSKVYRCLKCKYCSRSFRGQSKTKLFHKHVRRHEKRYQKHWLKRVKHDHSVGEDGKRTCKEKLPQTGDDNRWAKESEVTPRKMISKEVFVYIVFASQGVCRCVPDTQSLSTMPCDCEFTYKKLIFDSIEHMHTSTKEGISYDCPKCKKNVLPEKLKNDAVESCSKCNDKFSSVEGLLDHQQGCYGYKQKGPSFQCLQCSHKTQIRAEILVHACPHSAKGTDQAGVAIVSGKEDSSTTTAELSKNLKIQIHRPTKSRLFNPYPCPICGERYPDSSKLKQHVTNHQRKGNTARSLKEHIVKRTTGKASPKKNAVRRTHLPAASESDIEDEVIPEETSPLTKSGMSLRPRKPKKTNQYLDDDFLEDEVEIGDSNQEKALLHKCNYCERTFKRVAYLQNHKQTMHSGKAPFVCLLCLKRFQLREDFAKHSKSHKDTVFQCQFCSASFGKMELLHNHDHSHSSDKPFNCTVCGATFLNASSLSKHFKTHPIWDIDQQSSSKVRKSKETSSVRKSNSYVCPICKSLFDNAQELKKHSKVHEVERFKCKLCGTTCKSRLDLMNHTIGHKHKCQYCELDFLSLAAWKKHEQSHLITTSVYKCSHCPKEFKFKIDHKIHESLHAQFDGKRPAAEPTKKFKCKYCGKSLAYQRDLKIHELLHETKSKSKEIFCDQCGRKFDNKSAMHRHRHNHFRDKLPVPTKCPDCDKIFKYGSLFREHKKLHWPEKPFECMYCKARFKTKPELEAHEVAHTVGKKHACPICNRRFGKKRNCRIHIRTHTGEKPYQCAYCPKRFPQTSLRIRHERIHTGECPYVCDICQRSFPYDSSLKVHYESHKKKGLTVPSKFGMAKGLRRKNAPSRKPPGATKRRKEQPRVTAVNTSAADTSTNNSSVTTLNLEQEEAIPGPSRSSIPVPISLSESPQVQDPRDVQQNTNAPIQLTIQPAPIQLTIQQGEQMQATAADHQSAAHHGLMQRSQEDLHAPESSWEALHSRYLQQTSAQNWQPSHNWQPISQPLQNPSNWEMPSGNWSAGPPPPAAHQGHSSGSVITSALYGIVQRDNDGQRGYMNNS